MLQSKYLKLVKHDNYAKLTTTIQLLNSKGAFNILRYIKKTFLFDKNKTFLNRGNKSPLPPQQRTK